jgi:class 3 adenylate cyclase
MDERSPKRDLEPALDTTPSTAIDVRPRTPDSGAARPRDSGRNLTENVSAQISTKNESPEARLANLRQLEETELRRPAILSRLIHALPTHSPLAQLALAVSDSFFYQLVLGLAGTVGLVVFFHLINPQAHFTSSLLYIYFLVAVLHFSRFPLPYSVAATTALLLTGFVLFLIPTGSGANVRPLLSFRPSALFWVSCFVVNGVASALQNRFVMDLVDRRVALMTLQRQVREKEERAGKVVKSGQQVEDVFTVARQAESERKVVVQHYSTLFYHLQTLSKNMEPAEVMKAVWSILKSQMEATACEVYTLRGDTLELSHAFRQVKAAPDESAGISFEERMMTSPEAMSLDKCPHREISIEGGKPSLFRYVCEFRKPVFREEVEADRLLTGLAEKHPLKVQFCFPLLDSRDSNNVYVKGLINVSECRLRTLGDEDRQTLRTVADLSAMAISHWEVLEKERGESRELKRRLGQIVAPSVMDEIMKSPSLTEPRRQKISVMFVDLRGFTAISESVPPQVVVQLLADFFGVLTPVIMQYMGTLDKYIGDEIMALWGAPLPQQNGARRAIACAWAMREAFAEVRARWAPRLGRPVEMGIAINTGEAMVGWLGSESQKSYTAIGDAVNTAARLEGETGAGKIHVTRSTYLEIQDMVEGEWRKPIKVQGKQDALEIFDVLSIRKDMMEVDATIAGPIVGETPRIMASRDLARQVLASSSPNQSRQTALSGPQAPNAALEADARVKNSGKINTPGANVRSSQPIPRPTTPVPPAPSVTPTPPAQAAPPVPPAQAAPPAQPAPSPQATPETQEPPPGGATSPETPVVAPARPRGGSAFGNLSAAQPPGTIDRLAQAAKKARAAADKGSGT